MTAGSATAALAAALLLLAILIYLWNDRDPQQAEELPQRVTVDRVIDGDTFTASTETGEDLGRIRVLGIDTPETARDGQPAQCHATEASAAATQLLQGHSVQISRDPGQDQRDVYGRLLVYVDVDGHDFSHVMLTQGHARLYEGPAIARQREYRDAVTEAQERSVGIWGNCE